MPTRKNKSTGSGHTCGDIRKAAAASVDKTEMASGYWQFDTREVDAAAVSRSTAGEGQDAADTLNLAANPGTILALRELQAQRVAVMGAQRRINNQTWALARRYLGWSANDDEKSRDKVKEQARTLVADIENRVKGGEPMAPEDADRTTASLWPYVAAAYSARVNFDSHRKHVEKRMEALAKSLPVSPFVDRVRGFGLMSLAVIVGEAGDLSGYANPGKLWKRFGLAPVNGRSASQWRVKGGLSAAEWEEAGYSPSRRSVMFNVGDSLMKQGEEYRQLYLDRKAYERERDPEMKPIAAHRRAQRYMEKRLLRDLWRAWQKANGNLPSESGMPAARSAA